MNASRAIGFFPIIALLCGCGRTTISRPESAEDHVHLSQPISSSWENTNVSSAVDSKGSERSTNSNGSQVTSQPTPEEEEALKKLPIYQALQQAIDKGDNYYNYKTSAERILVRLKEHAKPEAIQAWAAPILKLHATVSETTIVSSTNLPGSFRKLGLGDTPIVAVVPGLPNEPSLIVDWGGGFGHQGVAIGGAHFAPSNPNFYYLKWVDGIYVYHSSR